jgi:hypothetical protein
MESKKINQLATELAPELSDLTIIGDPTTGISKKITLSQMASLFTGTVEEYANLASFPLVGAADTIYIALDTNIIYRWNTSTNAYVELSPNIVTSLVFNDANGFDGTISLVGSTATLTIATALTQGSVPFIGTSGALTQDNANLFFDDTNNRLGINTNSPTTALDVFGSGIIGRVNGTSTNNAFLGFASAGSNKWSIGNVQSDHRFRIFSETNTSELVSVLQTGEFGIGIANPTTKIHIDGGATALIANLDANISVAKSISFRSDNSNRINLEVSGTESGSNVGADLFVRTYTDLGALIETPLSIVRSTGVTTIKSLTLTNALSIANGGTGSITQNFVDLTTNQNIGGVKTFTNNVAIRPASGYNAYFQTTGTSLRTNYLNDALSANVSASFRATDYSFQDGSASSILTLASNGVATFSSTAQNAFLINSTNTDGPILLIQNSGNNLGLIGNAEGITNGGATNFAIRATNNLIFSTGGANPRMTITSGGNVLIGTTTDNGKKLQVIGSIYQSGSNVNFQQNTQTFSNGGTATFGRNDSGYGGTLGDNIGGQIIISISEPNSNVNSNTAIYVGTVNKPRGADATVTQISKTLGGGITAFTVTNSGSDITVTATSSSASTLRVTLTFIGGGGLS